MSLKKQMEELKRENKALIFDLEFSKRIRKAQEKIIDAYKQAWRRVHPKDQQFMFEFESENNDPDLFDVFNGLLYSFGRPGKDNIVFTRLDSWNK